MLKIVDLERLELNILAMYCLRVFESPAADSLETTQAKQLKTEWALFIGLRLPGLDTLEDLEDYGRDLKQRMVSFLTRCSLLSLSFATPHTTSDAKAQHAMAEHAN